jgi:hypothetical protein
MVLGLTGGYLFDEFALIARRIEDRLKARPEKDHCDLAFLATAIACSHLHGQLPRTQP